MPDFFSQRNETLFECALLENCLCKTQPQKRGKHHPQPAECPKAFLYSKRLSSNPNGIGLLDSTEPTFNPLPHDSINSYSKLMQHIPCLHKVGFSKANSCMDTERQAIELTEILKISLVTNIRPKLFEQNLDRLYSILNTKQYSSISIYSQVELFRTLLFTIALREIEHPIISVIEKRIGKLLRQKPFTNQTFNLLSGLIFHACLKGEFSKAARILNFYKGRKKYQNIPTSLKAEISTTCELFNSFNRDYDNWFLGPPVSNDHTSTLLLSVSTLAKGALSRNTHKEALNELSSLKRHSHIENQWISGFCSILRGWAAIENGKAEGAICHIAHAKHIMEMHKSVYFITLCHIMMTLVYIEKDLDEQAAYSLDKSRFLARKYNLRQLQFHCLMIYAEIALRSSNKSKTMLSVKRAFSFGRRHGLAHTWFPRPHAMSALCEKALDADIETEYADMLIHKHGLTPSRSFSIIERWPWPVKIRTLDKFSMTVDGNPINFNKRMRKTPFTMLKILIAMGGRGVSTSLIKDMLWPEAVGDEAFNRHKITLHRLKKILGHPDAIIALQGQLSLNPIVCWVDLWDIEKLFHKITRSFCSPSQPEDIRHEGIQAGINLLSKMNGIFLPENRQLWATKYREIIKQKYIYCIDNLASAYENSGNVSTAIKFYEKAIEIYPEVEHLYQRLIYCYKVVGKRHEATAAYKKCKKMLSIHYALVPSMKTTQLVC